MSQELYNYRVQNMIDAASFKEPSKIPVGLEYNTWPFAYAGVKYKEVIESPEQIAQIYLKFFDDFEFDYNWIEGGLGIPLKSFQTLGIEKFRFAPDDICIEHAQAYDVYMSADDYEELTENPMRYKVEKLLKFKIPAFQEPREVAYEKLKKAAIQFKPFLEINDLIVEGLNKKEIVSVSKPNPHHLFYNSQFSYIFDQARGIKNSLIDLRRYPQRVRKACDALWQQSACHKAANSEIIRNDSFPILLLGYHPEGFLSKKDFDDLLIRYFLEDCKYLAEKGMKFLVHGEGQITHTFDS